MCKPLSLQFPLLSSAWFPLCAYVPCFDPCFPNSALPLAIYPLWNLSCLQFFCQFAREHIIISTEFNSCGTISSSMFAVFSHNIINLQIFFYIFCFSRWVCESQNFVCTLRDAAFFRPLAFSINFPSSLGCRGFSSLLPLSEKFVPLLGNFLYLFAVFWYFFQL